MASSLNTSTALPYKALPHHFQQAIRTRQYRILGLTLDVKKIIHVVAGYGLRGDGTEFGTQVAGFDPFGYEFKIAWYTMRGLYQNIDMPVIWHI